MAKKYTEWEDNIIRVYYPAGSWTKLLSVLPNRTRQAIQNRASVLGVKRLSNKDPYALYYRCGRCNKVTHKEDLITSSVPKCPNCGSRLRSPSKLSFRRKKPK